MSRPIALATGGFFDEPVEEVLHRVSDAGFRAVEIGTPPRHFDPWQHERIESVRGELARTGMDAVSIHAPFGGILDLADENPHHRNAAVGGIVQAASVLRLLGGSVVVVHPSDQPRNGHPVGPRLEGCVRALGTLNEICASMGLRLAIESPLPHLLGGHPDEFAWILGRVGSPAGACLDTAHIWLGGQWDRFMEVAGGRLLHVHASDTRGTHDDHLTPGEGSIDWGRIEESLRRVGYSGWIVAEVAPPNGAGSEHLAGIRTAVEARFP